MSSPLAKNFRHWFGELIVLLCGLEMPVTSAEARRILVAAEIPLRNGRLVTFDYRSMAALFGRDERTLANWADGTTIAGTDNLARFIALFPRAAKDLLRQHLDSLEAAEAADGCIDQLRESFANVVSKAAVLNDTGIKVARDHLVEPHERADVHVCPAEVRAACDAVDALADRCADSPAGVRPTSTNYPRSAI